MRKLKKRRKSIFIIGAVLVLGFVVFLGGFAYYLGIGKIRHIIHVAEYKINPDRFPNYSKNAVFNLYGIDVSHHNGSVDWEMVREKGKINKHAITFVFLKATEGRSIVDKRFKRNYREAKKEDFLCGAYHFFRPHLTSIEQFEHFKKNTNLRKGDLAPVLDIEIRGSLSLSRFVDRILNMLELMENHYGIKPIIYTNAVIYEAIKGFDGIDDYPLWLASYNKQTSSRYKNTYQILQFTDSGKVSGIKSEVDLNGFNGTKLKFQELIIK